jgi:inorganic phosphate transporter, PiT family
VRWGVAGNIVAAWVLTLPAAAAMGAATYAVTRLFGTGAVGPMVVSVVILAGGALLFARRAQQARTPTTTAVEA